MISSSISTALGAGSGIDTAKLVSDLVAASREPKMAKIDARVAANRAKIGAVAQLRSDVESLSTSLASLLGGDTLRSQAVISDESVLAVTVGAGARPGNLNASVEVTQLARAQTIYSPVFADRQTPVGQGQLTLTVGTNNVPIQISATNDSLSGLADAINASGSGVTAQLVNDNGGTRMVLKGSTGAANAFSLTVDAGSDPNLDQFAFGAPGGSMTLGQSALDAQFKVDGVTYSRPSNTVSDILPGISLSLKKALPGQEVTIGARQATAALGQTVRDFAAALNTLRKDLAAATKAPEGGALRALARKLDGLLGAKLTSDPKIGTLSDLGFRTNRDGTISIDDPKLNAVLESSPAAVEAIFFPARDAMHTAASDPGLGGELDALKSLAVGQSGILTALGKQYDNVTSTLDKDRSRLEAQVAAFQTRLERQFSSMDSRIAGLKATQSYLAQQIKLWSNP